MTRPTPFALVFDGMRDRFDRVRSALDTAGRDSLHRDAFLLDREVAGLLHELRPEEGFGDATEATAAFLHHAYLFWEGGEVVRTVSEEQLRAVIAGEQPAVPGTAAAMPSYVQLPPLTFWGVLEHGPPEPLDGWFCHRHQDGLEALAVFGLRPGRAGFTTLEVNGPPPGVVARGETIQLFEPIRTETGTRAGLGAVTSEAELLELCWRIERAR